MEARQQSQQSQRRFLYKRRNLPIIPFLPDMDSSCSTRNNRGRSLFVTRSTPVPEDVQGVLNHFVRLDNRELLGAADGIYTWLIYSEPESDDLKFICSEVVSPFEFGTRHQALAHDARYKIDRVYGSGELRKTGPRIEYNLFSGSYSWAILEPLAGDPMKRQEAEKAIEEAFESLIPGAARGLDETLIDERVIMRAQTQALYKQLGFNIFDFDNTADCEGFRDWFWDVQELLDEYKRDLARALNTGNEQWAAGIREEINDIEKAITARAASASASGPASASGSGGTRRRRNRSKSKSKSKSKRKTRRDTGP